MKERDLALKMLATSQVIRAAWRHPGFCALVRQGWAKSLPVPGRPSKRDFHITVRGKIAAASMEK